MTTTGVRGIGVGAFGRFLVHPRPYSGPIAALMVVFLLTLAANHFHLFSGLEHLAGDLTLAVVDAEPPKHVVIVDIDEAMYEQEFKGRSPLDPSRLATLIRDLSAASPRVIVVDVDTAHESFTSIAPSALVPPPPAVAPILVWFRDVRRIIDVHRQPDYETLALGWLLGAKAPDRSHRFGIGRLPVDSDGMVRRYRRTFEVFDRTQTQDTMPSLAWAAALAYCEGRRDSPCDRIEERDAALKRHDEDSDALLVFPRSPLVGTLGSGMVARGERPARISASDLLAGPWWHPYVAGKIVVLGGTYEAGRDTHRTAFGEAQGVSLWAASIENELQTPVHGYHGLWTNVADLVFALLFLYLNWRWVSLRPGTLGNVVLNLGVLVVLWLITWRVVNDFGVLVGIVPLIAGVWVHLLYDLAKESRELRGELDVLRHQARAAAPVPPPAPPA